MSLDKSKLSLFYLDFIGIPKNNFEVVRKSPRYVQFKTNVINARNLFIKSWINSICRKRTMFVP